MYPPDMFETRKSVAPLARKVKPLAVIFADGFEGGTFVNWTLADQSDPSAAAQVTTLAALEGSYGAHFSTGTINGFGRAYKDFIAPATGICSVEALVKVNSKSGTGYVSILELSDQSYGNNSIMRLRYNGAAYDVAMRMRDISAYVYTPNIVLNDGQTYRVQLLYDMTGAVPTGRVYVNQALLYTLTDPSAGVTPTPNRVRIAARVSQTPATLDTYVDSVTVADGLIGGVSGVPTSMNISRISAASLNVGQSAQVQVWVYDQAGAPLPGVSVGLVSTLTGVAPFLTQVTGADGSTVFSWTRSAAGYEEVTAVAGALSIGPVGFTWTGAAATTPVLTVSGNRFYLDGAQISPFMTRVFKSVADDASAAALINMLPTYKARGVQSISISFQPGTSGGGPTGQAFNADGSLITSYTARIAAMLDAAAAQGMAVFMTYFVPSMNGAITVDNVNNVYLHNAVNNATAFLLPWRNVGLYTVNEMGHGNYLHDILRNLTDVNCNTILGWIKSIDPTRVTQVGQGSPLVAPNLGIPAATGNSDFAASTGRLAVPEANRPFVVIEYERMDSYTDPGIFSPVQEAQAESDFLANMNAGAYSAIHSAYQQVYPPHFELGGDGSAASPGVAWWYNYLAGLVGTGQVATTLTIAHVGSASNPVGQMHTVRATVTDQAGAPVAGAVVGFELNGGAPQYVVSDALGQADFSWNSAVAGRDYVKARLGALDSGLIFKDWVAAALVPTYIGLAPAGSASNPVGTQAVFVATVHDQNHVPMSGIPVDLIVDGNIVATQATGLDGTTPFTITSNSAGQQTLAARVSGTTLQTGPLTITWTAVPPVLTSLALSVNPGSIVAGGSVTATARALDQFGVAMAGVGVTFLRDGAAVGSGVSDAGGYASASWSDSAVGSHQVTAQSGAVISPSAGYTVSPPPPVVNAVALAHAGSSTNETGAQHTVTAQVRDQYGSPMGGVNVALNSSVRAATQQVTDGNGIATFSWVGQAPGDEALQAQAGAVLSNTIVKTWTAPQAVLTFFSLSPLTATTNQVGTQVAVRALIQDQNRQPMAGVSFDVLLDGAVAGTLVTDALGQADFSWTSPIAGTQTVQGRSGINYSNTLLITWTAIPVVLTILNLVAVSATTLELGQQAVIRATATDQNGQPMVGVPVSFYMDGVIQGALQTVAGGTADFSLTETAQITHAFQARSGTVQSGTVSVTWQQAGLSDIDRIDLAHDGPDVNQLGADHSVIATVVWKLGAVPRILALDFNLNGALAQTINTDPVGQARFTWTRPLAAGEGTDSIYASADGIHSPTLSAGWTAAPPAGQMDWATIGLAFGALVVAAIALGKK